MYGSSRASVENFVAQRQGNDADPSYIRAIGMQTGGSQGYRTVVPGGAAGILMALGFGGWRQQ